MRSREKFPLRLLIARRVRSSWRSRHWSFVINVKAKGSTARHSRQNTIRMTYVICLAWRSSGLRSTSARRNLPSCLKFLHAYHTTPMVMKASIICCMQQTYRIIGKGAAATGMVPTRTRRWYIPDGMVETSQVAEHTPSTAAGRAKLATCSLR